MTSYLMPYVDPRKLGGHEDPLFPEFTYGDVKIRGKILLNKVKKGDYLFFHTSRKGKRIITAYYFVEFSKQVKEIKKDKLIMSKYTNPHLLGDGKHDYNVVSFGNPIYSKILRKPLTLTPKIIEGLSRKPRINPNQTELAGISSALRNWTILNDSDVKNLLMLINESEKESFLKDTYLSSDEIEQLQEEDIEEYIWNNPKIIDKNLNKYKRQYVLESGNRLDLLLKDRNEMVVVEIKLDNIGKEVYNQINGYIKELRNEFHKKVKGVIVCRDILPAFEDFYLKKIEKDKIKVYFYSWKFNLRQFKI